MGLFSGLGKIAGKVISKVVPKLPGVGGIVGSAVGLGKAALNKLGRRGAKKAIAAVAAGTAGAGAIAGKVLSSRGGAAATGAVMGATATSMMQMGMAPSSGRRRRINPGNTKALRRAIRRVEAGARIYSKFFRMKTGGIKGAPKVRVRNLRLARAS